MRDDDRNPAEQPAQKPGCPGLPDDARSIGALIRAAADAELTEAQASEFERLCAERHCTEDRVRFEQTLRECCGRVMRVSPACSETLRNRVLTMAAAARTDDAHADDANAHDAGSNPEAQPELSAPERLAPATRSQGFWRQSSAMTAAAAVLLMVAGGLFWQASSLSTSGPGAETGWTTEQVSYRDRVSGFVTNEHMRCCRSDQAANAKLIYRDLDAARAHYAQTFGMSQVPIAALPPATGEVRFFGGGDCHVPGSRASAHLRFDAVDPEGNPLRLSLFIMPDNNRLPVSESVTYRVTSSDCEKAGVALYAWKSNGLIHLLVTEAKGEFCSTVRDSFLAPAQVAGL